MPNPDHRNGHVMSLVNVTHGITDTERHTQFCPCSHNKHFLYWSTSFDSSLLFHLSPVMTGALLSANTQLKLGHMFFLTHYYYACTVRVAASRCHSVPCATSLRMHYNVISQWDPWLACNIQSFSWRTERQVIFSREYLPLECSLHFAKAQSTMFGGIIDFLPAWVKFYQPTSSWSGQTW